MKDVGSIPGVTRNGGRYAREDWEINKDRRQRATGKKKKKS